MRPILRAEGISKDYQLLSGQRHSRFTEALASTMKRRLKRQIQGPSRTIHALRDVTFDVQPGEVLGLIGRNGAGKSTLLKIFSRITLPSAGFAEVRGRLGSLLEAGSGFHPELSGRENVYLTGSIIGLSRREIDIRFDEIVAFAETERFIDSPIKFYSSGMQVRLAFAVSAHLRPEVLLVDEVLAVGDLAFQRKCLEHFHKLTSEGMTIVFVAHNMTAVQSACSRVIVLEDGRVACDGTPGMAIAQYKSLLQSPRNEVGHDDGDTIHSPSAKSVEILGFRAFDKSGSETHKLRFGEAFSFRIEIKSDRSLQNPIVTLGLKRSDGVIVCNFNNWYDDFALGDVSGTWAITGYVPSLRLIPDYYEIHVLVWPWGGVHSHGSLTGGVPFAATQFGVLQVEGPPLTVEDGVFQTPSAKWVAELPGRRLEKVSNDPEAIWRAFGQQGHPNGTGS